MVLLYSIYVCKIMYIIIIIAEKYNFVLQVSSSYSFTNYI